MKRKILSGVLSALVFIAFFSDGARSQDSDGNLCEGNILIANWAPVAGEDGPQIGSITLYYEFRIDSMDVTKRFKLKWFVGEHVVIEGKKYTREEIGPKFNEIEIKKISFKGKVYSEDKYVDDIVIEYPAIVPRSGGESGWFLSGSSDWNKLFSKSSASQTLDICTKGFEIRNPRIYDIDFGSLKNLIDTSIVRKDQKKEDTKDVQKQNNSETKSKKQKSGSNKRVTKFEGYFRQMMLDIRTGNIHKFRSNSWHFSTNMGLGFVRYPINVNSMKCTGPGSCDSSSYREFGFGSGLSGGLEFWPIFGKTWGLGGYGSVSFGWSPRSSITYISNYGLRGVIGMKPFHFTLDGGRGVRSMSYKLENGSPKTDNYRLVEGESNYSVDRISVGIRTWIGRQSRFIADVNIRFEHPSYVASSKWATVWIINVWLHNYIKGGVEFSFDYPSPGKSLYATDNSYSTEGTYLALFFSKSFDFFGRPYRSKKH